MGEDSGLSEGIIQTLINGGGDASAEYILQVVSGKNAGNGRVHVDLHDTKHTISCLLPMSCNGILEKQGEDGCQRGSVVQGTGLSINTIAGKKVLIMNTCEVLQKECEMLTTPDPKPFASAPPASKPAFGGRQGFGGNNAFANRSSSFNTGGSRGGGGAGGRFHPVKSLNPFMKDFQIKVRVTQKAAIRHWKNARGEGKLFNVNLLDSEGTEIQATAFNDTVDNLYPRFEEGKVFIIRKARVKVSNKRFTHIKHEYCLDLADAEVEMVQGDDGSIAAFQFEFKTIQDISDLPANTFADTLGICTAIGEVQNFTSKKGNELTKRSFTIVDQTSFSIECTLWGDQATTFDPSNLHKVIALQAAKVGDYGGKSLGINQYHVNPEVPETQTMQQWWSQNQGNVTAKALTTGRGGGGGGNEPPIPASEAKQKGQGENVDYFNCRLQVTLIPVKPEKRPWYNSCPAEPEAGQRKCLKKVMESGAGWSCPSCNRDFTNYIPRWVIKVKAQDYADSLFLSGFDEVGNTIIGVTAAEAENMFEANPASYEALFTNAVGKTYNMRLRAKTEFYQDEPRQRVDIMSATALDLKDDMAHLSKEIKEMLVAA